MTLHYILMQGIGVAGIALSSSIVLLISSCYLLLALNRKLVRLSVLNKDGYIRGRKSRRQ